MSKKIERTGVSRRTLMAAGLAGAGVLAMPTVLRAPDRSLKVGVYGGYFQSSFDEHIFPEFTKASGIAVESVAEPTGEAWLVRSEEHTSELQSLMRISYAGYCLKKKT